MSWLLQLLLVVVAGLYNAAPTEAFGYVAYNESSRCVVYKALPACFGPQLPAEGLSGYLVRVTPPNACRDLENPPAPQTASERYIALIQGHDCSFVEKVLYAQQAGYQTAVVYNENSEQLTTMMADDEDVQQLIKIPSLFTGESVSLHLQRTLQCNKKAHVRLLPPKHNLRPCQDNAKVLQKASAIQDFRHVLYIVTATVSVALGLRWYKSLCKIKLHTYKQGDKYESCAICMAEYKEGDYLKILSCSHAYHRSCIDTWFHTRPRSKTCPFCKQAVNACGQDDLLPEQAGEDGSEEQDEEHNALTRGHEEEYTEEEEYVEEEEGDENAVEERWLIREGVLKNCII